MSWVPGTYFAAVCDRCGSECESEDTGGTVLFSKDETGDLLKYYEWREVKHDNGQVELICPECWDSIGADDALIAKDVVEQARYDQTGPDLLGGDDA